MGIGSGRVAFQLYTDTLTSNVGIHTHIHTHTPRSRQPLTNIETMEMAAAISKGAQLLLVNTVFFSIKKKWSRRSSGLRHIFLHQRKHVSKVQNHYTCDEEKNTETYRMQTLADRTASLPRSSTQSNFSNELFRPFWHITCSRSHFGVFFESSCLLRKR